MNALVVLSLSCQGSLLRLRSPVLSIDSFLSGETLLLRDCFCNRLISNSFVQILLSLVILTLVLAASGAHIGNGRVRRGIFNYAYYDRCVSFFNVGRIQLKHLHLISSPLRTLVNDRPPYRYPYYDNTGKGSLLYGFGDSTLYQYNKFKPLEGIYRR